MSDYLRQLELLNPKEIKNKSITVIGAGATGSYVAQCLAQMGWGNSKHGQGVLRVFDGDSIEEHNLCNQIYDQDHIGKPKVEALKEIILRKCGFTIEVYNEMVDKNTRSDLIQSNYVFLLTDTMKSRKEIFETFLKFSINTDLVIETRMGLKDGRVYAFNPNSPDQKKAWLETLYTDKEAEISHCGASASIVSTSMFLASIASQRVIQHFDNNYKERSFEELKMMEENPLWNEVHFSLYPENFYMRQFGKEPVLSY